MTTTLSKQRSARTLVLFIVVSGLLLALGWAWPAVARVLPTEVMDQQDALIAGFYDKPGYSSRELDQAFCGRRGVRPYIVHEPK